MADFSWTIDDINISAQPGHPIGSLIVGQDESIYLGIRGKPNPGQPNQSANRLYEIAPGSDTPILAWEADLSKDGQIQAMCPDPGGGVYCTSYAEGELRHSDGILDGVDNGIKGLPGVSGQSVRSRDLIRRQNGSIFASGILTMASGGTVPPQRGVITEWAEDGALVEHYKYDHAVQGLHSSGYGASENAILKLNFGTMEFRELRSIADLLEVPSMIRRAVYCRGTICCALGNFVYNETQAGFNYGNHTQGDHKILAYKSNGQHTIQDMPRNWSSPGHSNIAAADSVRKVYAFNLENEIGEVMSGNWEHVAQSSCKKLFAIAWDRFRKAVLVVGEVQVNPQRSKYMVEGFIV